MSVVYDTYKAVDQRWRTARDIHVRVGCWGFISVRHALNKMADKGLIDVKSKAHRNGEVLEFRLMQVEAMKPR